MADETNPEIPAAPKKPAARKPAAPRKPATPKTPAPDAAAPSTEAPAVPVVPVAPETAPAAAAVPESATPTPAVPDVPSAAAGVPTTEAFSAPVAAPAKRKVWPFVLGGGIVVLILLIVGIVFAVTAVLGALGGDPKKAVTDYDLSFETADCELFQSTTTQEFQDNFFGEALDCDRWVENAKALTVDGEYQYDVKIVISKTEGDTAEVVTNETDTSSGDPVDYTLRYYLTKVDGHWLIEGIDNES